MISAADLDLLQAYLDRRFDAAATAALETRLQAEPVLAEALVTLAREEAIVCEWAKGARALEGVVADNSARSKKCRPAPQHRDRGNAGAGCWSAPPLPPRPRWPPWPPSCAGHLGCGPTRRAGRAGGGAGRCLRHWFFRTAAGPPRPGVVRRRRAGYVGRRQLRRRQVPRQPPLELGGDTHVSFEGKPGRRAWSREGRADRPASGPAGSPPMALATPHADALVRGGHFSFTTAGDSTLVEMQDGGVY